MYLKIHYLLPVTLKSVRVFLFIKMTSYFYKTNSGRNQRSSLFSDTIYYYEYKEGKSYRDTIPFIYMVGYRSPSSVLRRVKGKYEAN